MVRTKGRRKITVDQKEYVWYIKPGYDNPYLLLHMISADKTLVLIVPIDMEHPFVVQIQKSGRYVRYVPPFEIPKSITPDTVARLIRWAESDEEKILALGYPEYPDL